MNVGGGLAWAAQLMWTSAPCSADNRVTLLWVRRGGMLPVGSVNSKEHCNGSGRFKALSTALPLYRTGISLLSRERFLYI